jgi:anaerobic selenocysteine-containing dehydrogenase
VHPTDAARLGLTDGGMAQLRNGARRIDVQVEVSDEMMPGVVSLPHGWGHDLAGTRLGVAAERPGVNLNALLDENLRDPLSGERGTVGRGGGDGAAGAAGKRPLAGEGVEPIHHR